MHTEDDKIWLTKEEVRAKAAEIWRAYDFNADSDLQQIMREILPQYTDGWANIHKTQLADMIGLGIHNLKNKKDNE